MIIVSFSIFLLIIGRIIYKRHVPVRQIQECLPQELNVGTVIVDVRDYNDSYKSLTPNALNLPISYLVRHIHELPKKPLHIIASTQLEKNMSVRIIRKAGHEVKSYSLIEEKV
ncbi:rhodanese [Lysinibacillus sp. NPDC086135]|uniref:rhodanese n=1 Tax=Lysinibacillus sp. NPDC086135 TaxID=3364130 RepID=UPI0037FC5458